MIGTGIESVYSTDLIIAPNPIVVNEFSYINREWTAEEQQDLRIEIVDATGRVVLSDYPTDYPIAIKGLVVRGVYFVRIVSGTGEVHVGRLVVR